MRNCQKGKPCGKTCIDAREKCLIDAGPDAQSALSSLSKSLHNAKSSRYTLSPSVQAKSFSTSTSAQVGFKGVLNNLQNEGDFKRVNGSANEKGINWRSTLGADAKFVGSGDYGSFTTVSSDKLLRGENAGLPRQVGVKAGRIGANEVEALRIVGVNGLGPKLIGARISTRPQLDRSGNQFYTGIVAMTKVPAIKYDRVPEVMGVLGPKSEMYWKAMADLHRLGIAHNDMHGGNVFVDTTGKARFVDFGLAQISPKAALSEAMGSLNGSNWQFKASQYDGHAATARRNMGQVIQFLSRKGFNSDEIDDLVNTGIRTQDSVYREGLWGRVSDKDAKKLVDIFYDGI